MKLSTDTKVKVKFKFVWVDVLVMRGIRETKSQQSVTDGWLFYPPYPLITRYVSANQQCLWPSFFQSNNNVLLKLFESRYGSELASHRAYPIGCSKHCGFPHTFGVKVPSPSLGSLIPYQTAGYSTIPST